MRNQKMIIILAAFFATTSSAWAAAQWTPDSAGDVPSGSFAAGKNTSGDLHACRAIQPVTGAQILGYVGSAGCRVVRGLATGNDIVDYEVLETPDPGDWVTGWTGSGVGDGLTANGNIMYVCRLLVGNEKIPGKYLKGHATCYAWPEGSGVLTSATYPFETLNACAGPAEASAIPDSGDFNAGDGHVDAFIWNSRAATVKSWLVANGFLAPTNPGNFLPCDSVPQFSFSNFHYSELKKSLRGACACQ